MATVQPRREGRWRGLLFDLFLGGVPGVVLLLYSALVLFGGLGELIREASFEVLGLVALMVLLGTLGVFACLSLLTVIQRFARGTQASLTPRMAASLRWGLVTGVILTAVVILLLVFDLFQRGTGTVNVTALLICALFLAPAVVAAKYIRLLQKVGG